jgi:hypothetical protein
MELPKVEMMKRPVTNDPSMPEPSYDQAMNVFAPAYHLEVLSDAELREQLAKYPEGSDGRKRLNVEVARRNAEATDERDKRLQTNARLAFLVSIASLAVSACSLIVSLVHAYRHG